jgi:hypothetical protein
MTDDIQKRTWFRYYRNVEDFVLEAMRKSIEDWEKCALTIEHQEESNSKNKAIGRPKPVPTASTEREKTDFSKHTKPKGCPHYIGFLIKEHPEKTPLPNECLACTKITDCMVKS